MRVLMRGVQTAGEGKRLARRRELGVGRGAHAAVRLQWVWGLGLENEGRRGVAVEAEVLGGILGCELSGAQGGHTIWDRTGTDAGT